MTTTRRRSALLALAPLGWTALACGAMVLMSLQPAARASREDHLGSAACGACHAADHAAWQASAHARAAVRLLAPGSAAATPRDLAAPRLARCLGCHTTGDAPAGEVAAAEVGCEACHGAGAGYAADDVMRDRPLAAALGLRDLSTPAARAALCAGCHRDSTRRLPFDPEAAYKRIAHGARLP